MMVQMHVLHAVCEMEDAKAARGIGVVADILRGVPGKSQSKTDSNARFRCYGALSHLRLGEIQSAIQWMLRMGLVHQQDVGNGFPRPVLKLAEAGHEMVNMHPTPPPRTPVEKASGHDFEECFRRLRVWRSGIAKQRGIAAFCIFHDSVLKQLAEQKPESMDALRGIPGIGPKKLADYGEAVLRTIAED